MNNSPINIQVDPLRAAQVLDLEKASEIMNIRGMSPKLIKRRVMENPIWRKYFWMEGTFLYTSLGNLMAMQAELAREFAKQFEREEKQSLRKAA